MSEREADFIKQLRKWVTIFFAVLTPFIIAGVVNLIVMVPQVRANAAAIDKFGEGYVSRDVMMQYMEAQRGYQNSMIKSIDKGGALNTEEHRIMNARIDELMKETYTLKQRGFSLDSLK